MVWSLLFFFFFFLHFVHFASIVCAWQSTIIRLAIMQHKSVSFAIVATAKRHIEHSNDIQPKEKKKQVISFIFAISCSPEHSSKINMEMWTFYLMLWIWCFVALFFILFYFVVMIFFIHPHLRRFNVGLFIHYKFVFV